MPDDLQIHKIGNSEVIHSLDLVKHGIVVFDHNMNLSLANRPFRVLMDYPAELCIPGTPFQAFIAYDCDRGLYGQSEQSNIIQQLGAALATRAHSSIELYLNSGRIVEIDYRRAANGYVVATYTDITRSMRASEEKERDGAIIRQLPYAVVLTDLAYRITYYNPAFQRIFPTLHQKGKEHYLPPHGVRARIGYNDFIAELESAMAQRGRHDFEIDILDKDRRRRTLQGHITPRRDLTLGHVGYLALYRDITEQARDRRRLERQDRIIAQLSEGVIIADQFGFTRDCNPAVEKLYGYGLDDLKGKRFLDVVSAGDKTNQVLADHIVSCLLAGERWCGEVFLITKNGQRILSECNVQPFYDDQGNHIGMIGVHRDITERQRHQDEIQRQTLVIEHMSEAVVVTDDRGVIEEFNASARRILGLLEHEAPSNAVHRRLVSIAESVARTGRYEVTYSLDCPKNGNLYLECLAMPVRSRNGSIDRIVSVHRDVTEKVLLRREEKKLAATRERSRRLETLGQIAGGIAHDFNNILTPILGYSHLVKNALAPESRPFQDMDRIIAGMEKARDMVKQILMFGQKIEPPLNPENIDDILASTLDLLAGSIPQSVKLNFVPGCEGLTLPCNKTLIGQLVLNLCYNALQAMPDGGTLNLGSDTNGDWEKVRREYGLGDGSSGTGHIRFWVEDTGIGISTTDMDRIFEPFYTTKRHGKGTGLGLSVAHGVVRAHDGAILVKTSPGLGTRFEIYLPIRAYSPTINTKKAVNQTMGNGENILVVEDDPKVCELLARILSDNNYQVTCAPDGRPALEYLVAGNPCDLVLSDLGMPGLGGEGLVKEIRKHGSNVPFILMSALIDDRTIQQHHLWGVDALVSKPIIPNDLFDIIQVNFAAVKKSKSRISVGIDVPLTDNGENTDVSIRT